MPLHPVRGCFFGKGMVIKMILGICDNDEDCLKRERILIEDVLGELDISSEIHCFLSPSKLIESGIKFDILFLDVEMDHMNGLQTAEMIHKKYRHTLIFFVTNYEGYMDEALNRHAFRFWVKPINRQRLIYGIESAVKEISSVNTALNVTMDKKLLRIPMSDIIYVCAQNKMTNIVTVDGSFDVKEAYKNVCSRLNKEYFYPSHASYCVNLNYVVKYTHDEVLCRHNDKEYSVFMSKRKYRDFASRFIEWIGENV